jgi:hypothetical protein
MPQRARRHRAAGCAGDEAERDQGRTAAHEQQDGAGVRLAEREPDRELVPPVEHVLRDGAPQRDRREAERHYGEDRGKLQPQTPLGERPGDDLVERLRSEYRQCRIEILDDAPHGGRDVLRRSGGAHDEMRVARRELFPRRKQRGRRGAVEASVLDVANHADDHRLHALTSGAARERGRPGSADGIAAVAEHHPRGGFRDDRRWR